MCPRAQHGFHPTQRTKRTQRTQVKYDTNATNATDATGKAQEQKRSLRPLHTLRCVLCVGCKPRFQCDVAGTPNAHTETVTVACWVHRDGVEIQTVIATETSWADTVTVM